MTRKPAARRLEPGDPAGIALVRFVEGSPSAKVITDRGLRILGHSRTWPDLLGLAGRKVVGRSLLNLYPKVSAYSKMVYDWALAGNAGRGERMQMPRVDGKFFWCDAEIEPWRDSDGEIAGLVSTINPVAEAVAAEDRQRRSQRRLELAMRLSSLLVWEMDFTRGVIETNGQDTDIFDRAFSFEELMAEPLVSCHPLDRERLQAHVDADMTAGASSPVEYRINREDGATVWVSAISELVFEDGQPTSLVGVMQNVTQRKLAELAMAEANGAAQAANRAKSTFLAMVTHEIRTPLNGVLGMAQAMAADELTPVQRDRLTVIRESGASLLAVLNDVLDLSKIEVGKLELDEVEFGLAELARGAHAAFTSIANQKALSFNLTVENSARGRYRGDSARIRQILYNLISNALKFTDDGSVWVEIGRRAGDIVIEVRDTGAGIPPDAVNRIFEKFTQADATTTRRRGGTGLGLSICRELAALMGGDIGVETQLGQGSVFRVRLPLVRLGPEHEASPARPSPPTTPAPVAVERELRVLAAEDNTINQLVLKTLLAQIGVVPVVVEDGQAAVEAWAEADWDIILMDVQMPRLDGVDATREIRRREAAEGRPRTPIVALTANALAHQRDEYAACGMDAVVGKPLEVAQLFSVMSAVLGAGATTVEEAA